MTSSSYGSGTLSNFIDIRDNTAATGLLADVSLLIHKEEVNGTFDETVEGVKKIIGDRAYPEAAHDYLSLVLDSMAEESDIGYGSLIVAEDRKSGEKLPVFSGITRKG